MVYRVATREHWDLVVSMVEEPLDEWEKHHGVPSPKRKQNAVEKKYLKVFEEQVALQVRAWGIEEPPSCRQDQTRNRSEQKKGNRRELG